MPAPPGAQDSPTSPNITYLPIQTDFSDYNNDNSIMHECNISTMTRSSLNHNSPNGNVSNLSHKEIDDNPLQILKKLKINNLNRLIIGHLNINSLRNKFESLKYFNKRKY